MRGQKGITLVALVITIIVMLILVGVSVTVAINGGLFTKAKEGATNTQVAANAERNSMQAHRSVHWQLSSPEEA